MNNKVRTIQEAEEKYFDIGNGMSLWYQTWGNPDGIPVLFVHGGPGNSVDDYKNVNQNFFCAKKFFIIEVDQRGTGKSQPSVRNDYNNMKLYLDISCQKMSEDFEQLRQQLGFEKWLVFGGSWGSALGLDYAERYPQNCLGLIIRGIFTNTISEFDIIYARKSFINNPRRLKEFDIFFELPSKEAIRRGEKPLDPDDSQRFIQIYQDLALSGNKESMWRFYVFENNLCADNPDQLLDPYNIDDELLPVAQSITFFESRLFLRGAFEDPLNLLDRVACLNGPTPVQTWVCQGTGDEVCPETYAHDLVNKLQQNNVPHKAYFIDAGHRSTSDSMKISLKKCVDEFYDYHVKNLQ